MRRCTDQDRCRDIRSDRQCYSITVLITIGTKDKRPDFRTVIVIGQIVHSERQTVSCRFPIVEPYHGRILRIGQPKTNFRRLQFFTRTILGLFCN